MTWANIQSAIWTTIALIGTFIQIYATRDSRVDLKNVQMYSKNQRMKALASLHLITAVLRLFVCLGNFIIGAISFFSAEFSARGRLIFGASVVFWLLTAEFTLISLTFIDRKVRRNILSLPSDTEL